MAYADHVATFWSSFHGLDARGRQTIELVAAACGAEPTDLIESAVVAMLGHSGPPAVALADTRKVFKKLREAGFVVVRYDVQFVSEDFAESVRRKLIADGRFDALTARIDHAGKTADRSRYWWSRSTATAMREVRRAFVAGDERRLQELLRQSPHLADYFMTWVTGPLDVALLSALPVTVSGPLVERLCLREFDTGRPTDGLGALVADLGRRHPESAALRRVLFCAELMDGRVPDAVLSVDDPHPRAALLDGLRALMVGNLKKASSLAWEGLRGLKKQAGGELRLSGPDGLLAPVALALHGGKTRLGQASRLVAVGEEVSAARSDLQGAYDRLLARMTGAPIQPQRPVEHPLATLIGSLVSYWSEQPLEARNLTAGPGLPWIEAELDALRHDDPSRALPGTVALMTHQRSKPVWERRLDSLEQELGPRRGAAAASDEPTHRVAWIVTHAQRWVSLEAREQARGPRGWSAGRKISDARVAGALGDVKGVTDHDRRIAAGLRLQRSWGGVLVGEWSVDDVWPALVGHPAVFRDTPKGAPLEIVHRAPSVRLRRDGSDLVLTVEPPFHGPVTVTELGHGSFEVLAFDDGQTRLAKVVGEGIRVPRAEAGERLGGLAASLARHFQVHDDAGTAEAEDVAADPRLVLQLAQEGSAFVVRVFARPFGAVGPVFFPGAGRSSVLARIGERTCRVSRDTAGELQRLDLLISTAPVLAGIESASGIVLEPEATLDLMLALQSVAELVVEWPQGQTLRLLPQLSGRNVSISVKAVDTWFAASGSVRVDEGLVLELSDLVERVRSGQGRFLQLDDGQFLALTGRLRSQLELLGRVGTRAGKQVKVPAVTGGVLGSLVDDAGRRRVDGGFTEHLSHLERARERVEVPARLEAQLRPYQEDGFSWAARMADCGLGICLADDMGLGKTVQALGVLLHRAHGGPALVVAPTSVCDTWMEEAWRFAPTLRVHRFGGGDRQALLDEIGPLDVVVCSYGLLQTESERLGSVTWHTLVLDEAQAIKNPETARHKAASGLRASARIALTGTPIENHLGELWALFSVLNPGMLGTRKRFTGSFAGPIERGERQASDHLRRLLVPFILRRTKSAVLRDLPPRTEIVVPVELGDAERALYEALRRNAVEQLAEVESGGDTMRILAQLTRLRLACCHPSLVLDGVGADTDGSSAKLVAFGRIVENLRAGGHRALVFSQFVRHLTLIRAWLDERSVPYLYLDGSTPAESRGALVRSFQGGEGELFLISLRAGGTGLNLTGADYVIHMDPWWNPAVEDQASDRAHRIGQERPVTVYRLVAKDTVEEQIVDLHHRKRDLADQLLDGTDTAARLSHDALLELIRGAGG